jgi:hypothetical protein
MMFRISILAAAVILSLGLGGCASDLQPVPATTALANDSPLSGAVTDGHCVYRTVQVFDRESGYYVDKQQRFCGKAHADF